MALISFENGAMIGKSDVRIIWFLCCCLYIKIEKKEEKIKTLKHIMQRKLKTKHSKNIKICFHKRTRLEVH